MASFHRKVVPWLTLIWIVDNQSAGAPLTRGSTSWPALKSRKIILWCIDSIQTFKIQTCRGLGFLQWNFPSMKSISCHGCRFFLVKHAIWCTIQHCIYLVKLFLKVISFSQGPDLSEKFRSVWLNSTEFSAHTNVSQTSAFSILKQFLNVSLSLSKYTVGKMLQTPWTSQKQLQDRVCDKQMNQNQTWGKDLRPFPLRIGTLIPCQGLQPFPPKNRNFGIPCQGLRPFPLRTGICTFLECSGQNIFQQSRQNIFYLNSRQNIFFWIPAHRIFLNSRQAFFRNPRRSFRTFWISISLECSRTSTSNDCIYGLSELKFLKFHRLTVGVPRKLPYKFGLIPSNAGPFRNFRVTVATVILQ